MLLPNQLIFERRKLLLDRGYLRIQLLDPRQQTRPLPEQHSAPLNVFLKRVPHHSPPIRPSSSSKCSTANLSHSASSRLESAAANKRAKHADNIPSALMLAARCGSGVSFITSTVTATASSAR